MKQLARFALVGGSNTVATLALFVLLQQWWPATLAYSVVFALGLVYTTVLTARVVFGARLQVRTCLLYAGWYLLVYGVGVGVIQVVQALGDPSAIAVAVITVAVTAPLNFLGGRLLFSRSEALEDAASATDAVGAKVQEPQSLVTLRP